MINPILERELKSRTRTWRAPIAILVFLISIGMFAYLGYLMTISDGYGYGYGVNPESLTRYFDFISIFQLIIIMFVVPILTATSVSSERERQTLDLMLCADISPWTIIFGKIFAALAFVLLLIVLATPFLGIIFLLGGISLIGILKIELYYMATAFMLSTIGIYFSSKFKRNVTAIIMTYVFLAFLYFTPFFIIMVMGINGMIAPDLIDEYYLISALFGANPGFGLLSLLSSQMNVFASAFASGTNLPLIAMVPTWVISCVFFALISVIMLLLTYKNIKKK